MESIYLFAAAGFLCCSGIGWRIFKKNPIGPHPSFFKLTLMSVGFGLGCVVLISAAIAFFVLFAPKNP